MNGVSCLHIVVCNRLLVTQLFSAIDETNHSDINSFFLLESLFDLQHSVGGLEVEGLLHTSQSLSTQARHTQSVSNHCIQILPHNANS